METTKSFIRGYGSFTLSVIIAVCGAWSHIEAKHRDAKNMISIKQNREKDLQISERHYRENKNLSETALKVSQKALKFQAEVQQISSLEKFLSQAVYLTSHLKMTHMQMLSVYRSRHLSNEAKAENLLAYANTSVQYMADLGHVLAELRSYGKAYNDTAMLNFSHELKCLNEWSGELFNTFMDEGKLDFKRSPKNCGTIPGSCFSQGKASNDFQTWNKCIGEKGSLLLDKYRAIINKYVLKLKQARDENELLLASLKEPVDTLSDV